MRWKVILSLVALVVTPAWSVIQDEAFTVDFHHALLGLPQPHATFFHKPDAASNAALLYTLSDKGVVGAINPRDGNVLWRQSIAGQPLDSVENAFLVAGEDDGKILTAYGGQVTAWDASSGRLEWQHKVPGASKVTGLQPVPVLGSSTDGAVQDAVLLTRSESAGYTVSRLGGDGSGARWSHKDSETKPDAVVSIATSPKNVFYISRSAGLLSGQKTRVVVLDIVTGKVVKEYSVALDSQGAVSDGGLVAGSGSPTPLLVTAETSSRTLKVNVLGQSKAHTLTLENKGEDIVSIKVHHALGPRSAPHFLIHAVGTTKQWAEIHHMNTGGDLVRAYSLPATQEISAFAASSNGGKVYFTRVTDTEVIVFSSESHGHLGRWTRKELGVRHGLSSKPLHATAEVANRDGTSIAVRVAVTSPEGTWYLIRNGDTQWSRPEILAYADLATWSNDVRIDALAQELGVETSRDPATAYINRVYRHATELRHLPAFLVQLPQKLLGTSADPTLPQQDLVGARSLILSTKNNHVFSLSGTTGAIQWHADLSTTIQPEHSFRSLTAQDGRATLYSSDGAITVLNTTDGSVVETKSGSVPVARLVELPGSPASTILKINDDGVPQLASDLAPSIPDEGNVVLTINKKGQAQGWTIGTEIRKVWTFSPPEGKIIDVTYRPEHDPVASIGRVLGDRSVLYKYFTPNMAVLTSLSKTSLTLYLIDAVTGTVLYNWAHKGVVSTYDISSVLSENWLVYTFTSSDPETNALTTQLVISELYESAVSNDRGQLSARTNYSSYGADANSLPHVISSAFVLAEPLSHLAVTQTAQGITTRQVLAYLPASNAITALPRHVLDARRPRDREVNAAEAEEGLFRYQPQLELDPKSIISHSREVVGIKHISTFPTLLESTSTVFGFGHDIFGTQVAPSQTFDILGKSFKKIQLIGTVIALYLGVLAVRPLVRRTLVQRGWA